MKRILLSAIMLVGAVSAIAIGGTSAFFSDTETSTGNTFMAGAIDLKVDNTSYYNGVISTSTSWDVRDLTIEKFFNFLDLKPGDVGEDTISLHVDTNDAYLCANVKLTSNDDNGINEPEGLVDNTDGAWNGELGGKVNFAWWADDGDNVLESNETVISQGPIGALGTNGSTTITLADSQNNIWTGTGGPVPGMVTHYIGKAWCFGTLTPSPLAQDGFGTSSLRTPANSNGGILCDGSLLGNETQTDSLTADVTFSAVQSRNNGRFLCIPPKPTGTITVVKTVVNSNGGNNIISDFHFYIDDGFVQTEVLSGSTTPVSVGSYNIQETGNAGYDPLFGGDCNAFGDVVVGDGENKICTITNREILASITLFKVVQSGTAGPTGFGLSIDGVPVSHNSSRLVTSNTPHYINEAGRPGYRLVSIAGVGCPTSTSTPVILNEGQSIICTITNALNTP